MGVLACVVVLGLVLAGCATSGGMQRVSVASAGAQANGGSYDPSISADGRYVAFESDATNLVPATPTAPRRVRPRPSDRRDHAGSASPRRRPGQRRAAGVRRRSAPTAATSPSTRVREPGRRRHEPRQATCSCATGRPAPPAGQRRAAPAPRPTATASIAVDQRRRPLRRVRSDATNLVPGDTNAQPTSSCATGRPARPTRVSVASAGAQGNGYSHGAVDQRRRPLRRVRHRTRRTSSRRHQRHGDVFVRDRMTGTTSGSASTSAGAQANGDSDGRRSAPTAATSPSTRTRRTWSPATPTASLTCSCATGGRHDHARQRRQHRRPGQQRQPRQPVDQRRRPLRRLRIRARRTWSRRHERPQRRLRPRPRDRHDHARQRRQRRRPGERRQLGAVDQRRRPLRRLRLVRDEPRRRRHQ